MEKRQKGIEGYKGNLSLGKLFSSRFSIVTMLTEIEMEIPIFDIIEK